MERGFEGGGGNGYLVDVSWPVRDVDSCVWARYMESVAASLEGRVNELFPNLDKADIV
jgi:hypothetical protein